MYLLSSPVGGNKTIPHNPHIRLPYRNRCFNIYFQIQATTKLVIFTTRSEDCLTSNSELVDQSPQESYASRTQKHRNHNISNRQSPQITYPSITIGSSAFLGPFNVILSPKLTLNPSTAAKTGIPVFSDRYSASISGPALSILIPK